MDNPKLNGSVIALAEAFQNVIEVQKLYHQH